MVVEEVDKVGVDPTCGHREALLRLVFLAVRKIVPGHVHLLVHAVDVHLVLRGRGHPLEDKKRVDSVLLEPLQLFVDEAEDTSMQ